MRPGSSLFNSTAKSKEPTMASGMLSIKKSVLPRYFQKYGSRATHSPSTFLNSTRSAKLSSPMKTGAPEAS